MKLTIFLCTLLSANAFASGALTFEQLRDRLQIRGEMFRTDPSGKKLEEKSGETRSWRLRKTSDQLQMESNWSSNVEKPDGFAIHSVWTLSKDGTIKGVIEEYAAEEKLGAGNYKFKNLIKKEERTIENFAPVIWVSARPNPKGKTIVRFTPNLTDDDTPQPFTDLPISGKDMVVYDNEGYFWTDHVSGRGKFMGLTSYRGTVMFSFYPFAGAEPKGFAKDDRIELKLDGKKSLTIQSKTNFLPADMSTVVYARYLPGQKSAHIQSTHVSTSNSEKGMLENMKD